MNYTIQALKDILITITRPLGVDPYLDHTPFETRVRCLTGFAQQTRTGFYGQGQQVQSSTVSQAITVVGQTIVLAHNDNPTKVNGSDKFLPALQVMLDGYSKSDPPTRKMLPVEAYVPNLLVEMGYRKGDSTHTQAIGDLAMIAFYYLLRIGEYTVKRKKSNTKTKQTVQFKLKDLKFFKKNKAGTLVCLPNNAPTSMIMTANSATLKLDNQKNGWKGICKHQEANGESFNCPVRALARQAIHLQENKAGGKTLLSSFFHQGNCYDVCGKNISKGLELAATILQYPTTWGIPIERINTHSLRSRGANALALLVYSDTQIRKMGRWKGATFKEYIHEELACYLAGMTTNMKQNFKFVNISGNAYHNITTKCVEEDNNINCIVVAATRNALAHLVDVIGSRTHKWG
jgi:hypothetical protein